MKKTIFLLLKLCMMFSICLLTACAAETTEKTNNNMQATTEERVIVLKIDSSTMTVNGTKKEIDPGRDTSPIIKDDRTLVPVRAMVEEIGGTVDWDEGKQTALLKYENKVISLTIGSKTAYLGDTPKMLDVAPIVLNDRTMLPIRFVMESFGYAVWWNEESSVITIEKEKKSEEKTLVVYFSLPETDKTDNMSTEEANSTVVIDGKVLGNTQYVANIIKENTNADLFRIEPKTPYTTNHEDLVDQAAKEKDEGARPELLAKVENLSDYDTVFLGYPNWWGDMPMILYTFLESHDLAGKTVIPFNTHGGSGFSDTINTIKKLQPKANVVDEGFTVSRNNVQNSEEDVINWLKKSGYIKE